MGYRFYDITVERKDEDKANSIISHHMDIGNLHDCYVCRESGSNGRRLVRYRVSPYISEDLEIIKNDFKKNGIELF